MTECVATLYEAAAREANRIFLELLAKLGLPYAPHKACGPTRVIEFLGFLLVNSPRQQCIALTASRQQRMVTMIDGWLRRRPPDGETAQSEPREVAQLLGHLVFISDVVPGGRTYLQAIPRQFRGLEVDWARGAVRHVHGRWRADVARRRLLASPCVVAQRDRMRRANCTPMASPAVGEAAVTGSDASDYACVELGRSETASVNRRLAIALHCSWHAPSVTTHKTYGVTVDSGYVLALRMSLGTRILLGPKHPSCPPPGCPTSVAVLCSRRRSRDFGLLMMVPPSLQQLLMEPPPRGCSHACGMHRCILDVCAPQSWRGCHECAVPLFCSSHVSGAAPPRHLCLA